MSSAIEGIGKVYLDRSSSQLPVELLPHILEQLSWRVGDLASCCLVSRTWSHYATPLLYSRLFLRNQQRLIQVFRSLHSNSSLAKLVRVLEIRVFPFGLQAEELERLENNILQSLQGAVNLEELHWTRTGSLTDRVLPFLPSFPKLQTLEVTGSSRFYSPDNVTQHLLSPEKSPLLAHFSVVLPDRNVSSALPLWAEKLGSKLQSFSILAQHSALVTDETLKACAPYLTGLRRLSIAGCKAISCEGILALLRSSDGNMLSLSIEGLAIQPSSFSMMLKYLQNLQALSLTFPRQNLCPVTDFWQHLAHFVEELPHLQEFTHYTSSWNTPRDTYTDSLDSDEENTGHPREEDRGNEVNLTPREYRRQELEEHAHTGRPIVREPKLSTSFLRRLLASRGPHLRKLRIHGIVASMEQMMDIAQTCQELEDLVLHFYEGSPDDLQSSLLHLPNLTSLHVLSSLHSDYYMSEEDMRNIAVHATPKLRQVGFRNRVWIVERIAANQIFNPPSQVDVARVVRRVVPQAENKTADVGALLPDGRRLYLRRWDLSAGTFPEVLLVVRACESLLCEGSASLAFSEPENILTVLFTQRLGVLLKETSLAAAPFLRSMTVSPGIF